MNTNNTNIDRELNRIVSEEMERQPMVIGDEAEQDPVHRVVERRRRLDEFSDEGHPSANLRNVSIEPLSSGYLVKVGCQSVAVETTGKLLDMLDKYLNDPTGFEKQWYSKDVRNKLDNIEPSIKVKPFSED